jgi:hypothetical protein
MKKHGIVMVGVDVTALRAAVAGSSTERSITTATAASPVVQASKTVLDNQAAAGMENRISFRHPLIASCSA